MSKKLSLVTHQEQNVWYTKEQMQAAATISFGWGGLITCLGIKFLMRLPVGNTALMMCGVVIVWGIVYLVQVSRKMLDQRKKK